MLEFEFLKLKDHILFEDVTWRLNKYPLSVIRGKDLDSRIASSNGVGKSLLASTLATLLNDAPPMSVSKKSSKEMVFGKSEIELSVKNNKDQWLFKQYAKAKSVKYNVALNGIDQEVKDIKDARNYINSAVPLSEDHIYSQLYINSFRPSVLLYGKPSVRLDYFEQIFDLRIYDQLRQSVLEDLKIVNKNFLKSTMLQEQYDEIKPLVKKDVSKRLEKIKQRHRDILQQYSISHKLAQKLVAYVTLAEQLHSPATIKELQEKLKTLARKIKTIKVIVEINLTLSAELKQQEELQRKRRLILAEIKKLNPNSKAGLKLSRIQKQIKSNQKYIQLYNQYEKPIEQYKSIAKKYLKASAPEPDLVQTKLTTFEVKLKQKKQLKAGKNCPLCEQKVPHSHIADIKSLKKNVAKTRKLLTKAKIVTFIKKVQAKVPKEILALNIAKLHETNQTLAQEEAFYDAAYDEYNKYIDLKKQLKSLPKSKDIKVIDIANHQKKLDKYQEQYYKVEQDLKLLNKLGNMDKDFGSLKDAKKALLREQQIVADLTPRLQKISDLIQTLSQKNSDYNSNIKQIQKIEHDLKGLEKSINDREILDSLAKAYSNKGIRILQVQALAEAYIQTLNRFATYLYSKPVQFFAEVGSNKFDILCERNGKAAADVRSLSGAESRQYLALSALGLCSLMPNHLRSNLLILDELESGAHELSRKKFAIDFIPLVCEYVPNVVIITPFSIEDFYIPNAKELLLVKKNNVTKWAKS